MNSRIATEVTALTIVPSWAVSKATAPLLLVKVPAEGPPVAATVPVIEAAPDIAHAAPTALGLKLTWVAATPGSADTQVFATNSVQAGLEISCS